MTDRELARLADAMRQQAESENQRLREAMRNAVDLLTAAALAPAEPQEWSAADILKNEG